jgi:signal transduction histidine kinase
MDSIELDWKRYGGKKMAWFRPWAPGRPDKSRTLEWINHPILFFILFLVLLVTVTRVTIMVDAQKPNAVKGYLYGSNIDNRYPLMLSGEWEYYQNQFLFSQDFDLNGQAKNGSLPQFVKVPSQAPEPYGFGTYRLIFSVISRSQLFALKTTDILSSTRIYLDGKLIEMIGDPSTLTNASLPFNSAKFIIFPMDTLRSSHEIIIQYSNYDYYKSGLVSPIYFGPQESIYVLSNQSRLIDSICVMSLLILSILLLIIMLLKIPMGNIHHLLLFSIFQGLAILSSGEKLLLSQVREYNYNGYNRFALSLNILMGLFIYLFDLEKSSSDEGHLRQSRILVLIGTLTIAGIVLTPQNWQIFMVYAIVFYLALILILSITVLLKRMLQKNYGAMFQAMGLVCWASVLVINRIYQSGSLRSNHHKTYLFSLVIGFVIFQLLYVSLRISRVYSANQRLAERMIVSDKVKDEFIELVSHELRTPLHGIINITQSVTRDLEEQDESHQPSSAQDLEMVVMLARRMNTIVNDMYEFITRSGEPSLDLHPLDLSMEVNAVFELYGYVKTQSNVQLINQIGSGSDKVYADEKRLWQILINLIGNAIKYTQEGTISVSSVAKDNEIYISIVDTGIGMPDDSLDIIFNKSTRLPSGLRTAEGSGFGLYLTRRMVEEMGGRIFVEKSGVNQGTTITFTLKRCNNEEYIQSRVEERHVWKNENLPSSTIFSALLGENARILVVDDNPDNLIVIQKVFNDTNLIIDTALNGKDALALLEQEAYDIVVLDIMMPGMTGIEICQEIRQRFTPFDLPVLMLTARDSVEDVLSAFWAGSNDYVIKPADSVELRARVITLITLKQSVKSAIQSELSFLQAQIKPHFLFNAFNTISAIALTDGEEASRLIDDLSTYLRSSFQRSAFDQMIPIDRELELVQAYVNIEKARFGSRLQVEIQSDYNEPFFLPALTIQPIVENAIRHNSLASSQDIRIDLRIIQMDQHVHISVEDNGQGIEPDKLQEILLDHLAPDHEKKDTGIGLKNVNKRLKIQYNQHLKIESSFGEGTTVSFEIPLGASYRPPNGMTK